MAVEPLNPHRSNGGLLHVPSERTQVGWLGLAGTGFINNKTQPGLCELFPRLISNISLQFSSATVGNKGSRGVFMLFVSVSACLIKWPRASLLNHEHTSRNSPPTIHNLFDRLKYFTHGIWSLNLLRRCASSLKFMEGLCGHQKLQKLLTRVEKCHRVT